MFQFPSGSFEADLIRINAIVDTRGRFIVQLLHLPEHMLLLGLNDVIFKAREQVPCIHRIHK